MSPIPELDADQVAPATQRGLVLLDFYQATCAPCRALEPRLERFARRHRDQIAVYRIDIDDNPDTPRQHGVMSIPTLILFRDGTEVARLDGLIHEEDIEALLGS
jgi:thioredoxin